MEKEKKKIGWWITYGCLLIGTILIFVFSPQIFGVKGGIDQNGATIWIVEPIFKLGPEVTNEFARYIVINALPSLLRTIQVLGIAITLGMALHLLARITFREKKAKTISILIVNFLKWLIAIAAFFFILAAWGADTTMMIASAGVLTLIIGLGSQALVADILAGIFIVFEGDFQVGDIVIIDDWRGEVLSIGIRTTKLKDAGGNIKVINNSEIKTLVNQTQELSVALCYVSISYDVRIETVESIISDNLEKMKKMVPGIVEGPFYKGVSELGESGVEILFVAKCKEDDIYQVKRDMNRAIKIIFDDNNVEIPFNQIVVHQVEEKEEEKITANEKRKATRFVKEQRVKSDDIVIQDK